MARIVAGLGVSHTPQMSMPSELWASYARHDTRNPNLIFRRKKWAFEDLVAARATEGIAERINEAEFAALHARAQAAVRTLADSLARAAPDVVVVVGDDHHEIFSADSMPTFAVYWGETVTAIPPEKLWFPEVATAKWALYGEREETYPCHPALGEHLIRRLNATGFDVAQVRAQPEGASIGHTVVLVRNRLMDRDRPSLPVVPLLLNTYFEPNRPTPARCWGLGGALAAAIEDYPEDLAVAVVASGGLSHFVVDEEIDRAVLHAMRERDEEAIAALSPEDFVSGTSEALGWLTVGGACAGLSMEVVDYLPAYRTAAGTGCGMAMVRWL
jgi:3-O-methylgallate 3,4-dioxygenase